MDNFCDWLLEKCAGKGATANLKHRWTQEQFHVSTAAKFSEILKSENRSYAHNQSSPSPASGTVGGVIEFPFRRPRNSAQPNWVAPSQGSNAAILERAHPAMYKRAERALISFDHLVNTELEEEEELYSQGLAAADQTLPPKVEDRKEHNVTNKCSFLYEIPKLPQMIGVGRFRRSATATQEWIQENITERCPPPIPHRFFYECGQPGYTPRSPPITRFSDVSCHSSMISYKDSEIEYILIPENSGTRINATGQRIESSDPPVQKGPGQEELQASLKTDAVKDAGRLQQLDAKILKLGSYSQVLDDKLHQEEQQNSRRMDRGRTRQRSFGTKLESIKEQRLYPEDLNTTQTTRRTQEDKSHERKVEKEEDFDIAVRQIRILDGTAEHPKQEEKQAATQCRVRFALGQAERGRRQISAMRRRFSRNKCP
ncbi:hypothetical protein L228DRAFT_257776 [Xylona heveae TC161]|uniref:Uncharacterized protein n=1 Tax=Xylona heveae (strain CBS 132557 / TC161) TaxID=1328760 RepID=A0A165JJJ8_XYLHT|nr:hypothetical protein L228DRAFT_257776 [Xylona heveae TC161]KZF26317.1 hypothetical protein L228DRAFT_257776 [Xylona heveae TC161]